MEILEKYDTFKAFLKGELRDSLKDIQTHGCQGGFPYLTYYHQTGALYDKYEDEIWEKLEESATNFGADNILAFMGGFNGAKNVGNLEQFKNLLVWFYAEETARELMDQDSDSEAIIAAYEDGVCPNCKTKIPDDVEEGDTCKGEVGEDGLECGHAFSVDGD